MIEAVAFHIEQAEVRFPLGNRDQSGLLERDCSQLPRQCKVSDFASPDTRQMGQPRGGRNFGYSSSCINPCFLIAWRSWS